MRNLFRKVFIAGGYEELKEGQTEKDRIRRTRVPIPEFEAAVHMAMGPNSERLDRDEVECFIANMIYKVSWSLMTSVPRSEIGGRSASGITRRPRSLPLIATSVYRHYLS